MEDGLSLRVAVFGQGSIGTRHASILLAMGHAPVVYDPDPRAAAPRGTLRAQSPGECLSGVDAAIVASPSSEHPAHACAAIERGVPVLVEKPLALDGVVAAELDFLARRRGVLLSVAMSMREHAAVRALRDLLARGAVGRVLRASAWCGSWLPDWRPGSDYRESYSARAAMGGGVLLDVAVHEIDYLLWLLGPARSVSALATRVSRLEIDVEDVGALALELDGGAIADVAVDYLDRARARGCRIVGDRGTVHWSWERERLTCHAAGGPPRTDLLPSDSAPAYRAQLERFLGAVVAGAQAPVPAGEASRVLEVLDGARVSSRDGRRIRLAPDLTLRPVRPGDRERLRAWRNDADARRWSRSDREIGVAEHADWLGRSLADPTARLWIAEDGGRPVGHLRSTAERPGVAELHIVLAPEARGRGLAGPILVQGAARTLAEPGVRRLCAHVKPAHAASLRAFARAGFARAGSDADGLARLERRPAVSLNRDADSTARRRSA